MAGFSKTERLSAKKEIETLFSSGRSIFVFPFKIIYLTRNKTEGSNASALITVPKKLHAKAVTRNRIKRLTKEAYRLNKHLLEDAINTDCGLNIAFIYVDKKVSEFAIIQRAVQNALIKLSRIKEGGR